MELAMQLAMQLSEKAKNSGNGGAGGKNSNIFFLSKFPLEEYLESWDFQISPEINKRMSAVFVCGISSQKYVYISIASAKKEDETFLLSKTEKEMC